MTTTIVHHSSCPDGFAAAWLAWHYHHDLGRPVTLHPGIYEQPAPDCTGHDVVIVDFSYPPAELAALCARARTVTWLDHHASAIDDWNAWLDTGGNQPRNLKLDLDDTRSGALLAWDWYTNNTSGHTRHRWRPGTFFRTEHVAPGVTRERPITAGEICEIIERIDTRDRWVKINGEWALDGTEEVLCALTSRPYTIEAWDDAFSLGLDGLIAEGASIVRYRRQLIDQAVSFAYEVTIAGHRVHCANAPYALGSDVCEALNRRYPNEPFAAYWFSDGAEQKWGLRSNPDGADVAAIARLFGGGGHTHASGFRVPESAVAIVSPPQETEA